MGLDVVRQAHSGLEALSDLGGRMMHVQGA